MLESDLERIKQELETIKSQSDERGESMTDTRCQHMYMLQTRPERVSRQRCAVFLRVRVHTHMHIRAVPAHIHTHIHIHAVH